MAEPRPIMQVGESFDDWWKRVQEHQEREESIICPYCGYVHRPTDVESLCYNYISYHGEEGWCGAECESCGKSFYVQEYVRRTYEERKLEEGDGYLPNSIMEKEQ